MVRGSFVIVEIDTVDSSFNNSNVYLTIHNSRTLAFRMGFEREQYPSMNPRRESEGWF